MCAILRALETETIIYDQDLHGPEKHLLIRSWNGHFHTLTLRI